MTYSGKSVVLATGTFLRGCINIGLDVRPAGRMGDGPAVGLAKTLDGLGFALSRLKTGTPPRLLASTVNYGSLEKQVWFITLPSYYFISYPYFIVALFRI